MVRRVIVAIAVVALGSLGLAGCESSSLSYGDGYSVGQSLAANDAGYTTPHAAIVAACDHEWRVSASAVDSQREWIDGCIHGFVTVQSEVTTSHT
jgi:hypothetical protein